MFLGAAGGIIASHLPGFPITAAVTVGIAAAIVGVLRLPLAAVVITTLLTAKLGAGAGPLIIVAAVVSYGMTLLLDARWPDERSPVGAVQTALTAADP